MTHATPGSTPVVEQKVKASTVAAYVATFLLVALANAVQDVDHALILSTIPEWLEALLLPLVPTLVTFAAGYAAKHTHRPDLRRPPELNL